VLGTVFTLSGDYNYGGKFTFTGSVPVKLPYVPAWAKLGNLAVTATEKGITGSMNVSVITGLLKGWTFNIGGNMGRDFSFDWDKTLPISLGLTVTVEVDYYGNVNIRFKSGDSTQGTLGQLMADGSFVLSYIANGSTIGTDTYDKAGKLVKHTGQTLTEYLQYVKNLTNYVTSWIP
jgi:hypothetical protein